MDRERPGPDQQAPEVIGQAFTSGSSESITGRDARRLRRELRAQGMPRLTDWLWPPGMARAYAGFMAYRVSATGVSFRIPHWWPAAYRAWAARSLAHRSGHPVKVTWDGNRWVLQTKPPQAPQQAP